MVSGIESRVRVGYTIERRTGEPTLSFAKCHTTPKTRRFHDFIISSVLKVGRAKQQRFELVS